LKFLVYLESQLILKGTATESLQISWANLDFSSVEN
jgi:hypothetical protein